MKTVGLIVVMFVALVGRAKAEPGVVEINKICTDLVATYTKYANRVDASQLSWTLEDTASSPFACALLACSWCITDIV